MVVPGVLGNRLVLVSHHNLQEQMVVPWVGEITVLVSHPSLLWSLVAWNRTVVPKVLGNHSALVSQFNLQLSPFL